MEYRNELKFIQCACKFTDEVKSDKVSSQRLKTKLLIKELISYNQFVESNIFSSASNVNMDMILEINDNIEDIPHLVGIARRTIRTINISIAFALILNIIAMGLAILGLLNPIEGALIHNIGSVIVIIYSSTLTKYKISKKDYIKSKKLGMTKSLNNPTT